MALQSLLVPQSLSNAAAEPIADRWWLWIASLGPHTKKVIGAGVVGAELTYSGWGKVKIVRRRSDSSSVEIEFSRSEIINIVEE